METFNWCDTVWMPRMGYGIFHKGQPWMWYDASQIWMRENNEIELHIENKPVEFCIEGVKYNPKIACGTMKSVNSFGYGNFSAEIRLPKGRNLWPSFWLTGAESWPPEIDIVEAWSNANGSYFRMTMPQPPYLVPSWKTTNNVHFLNDMEVKDAAGSRSIPIWKQTKDPSENFIRYSVEWRPDKIVFRVGNKVVRTVKDDISIHIARKPMNIIFNIWTTGTDYSLTQPMLIRNFKYTPLVTN